MSWVDHLFVALFAVVYPLVGFISFRRLLRRIAAGQPLDRHKLYRDTIAGHWLLLAIAVLIWAGAGRNWTSLGMGLQTDQNFLAGALLVAAGIGILLSQVSRIAQLQQSAIDRLRRQFGSLAPLVPQNGSELARFYVVSLTAGVVEEVLWRGFLIWYLTQQLPLWMAAVLSALGFGVAHAYQGPENITRITVVGAGLVGLYLLSGSIWLSIVLHVAVDALQGRPAYEISSRSTPPAQATSS